MKIKKVDDKPLIIHTKQKAKIHSHEPKQAAIKGSNIYTVDRSPKIKGSVVDKRKQGTNAVRTGSADFRKNAGRKNYRKSTIHQGQEDMWEGKIASFRRQIRQSNQSINKKKTNLHIAGVVGTRAAADQMEGGEQVQQSAMIMYEAGRPVVGTASRGADLFKKQIIKKKQKIKKVEAGKKLAKKSVKKVAKDTAKKVAKETAKETAKVSAKVATKAAVTAAGTAVAPGVGTAIGYAAGEVVGAKIEHDDMVRDNRARKIKFFLDKMKAEDNQTDSVAKLAKDLVVRRAGLVIKQMVAAIAPFLLILVLLVSMIAVPVVAVVGVAYNSPFAIFLPPLEEGDTVVTVASEDVAEFNREINTLVNDHTGCDAGKIVYVDYEGAGTQDNFYDILAVYMVKYGVGDTATIMNDKSKGWLQTAVDDMCSYTTSTGSETETVENEDGSTSETTTTYLYVNVTLKTWRDMISVYSFDSNEQELLAEFMNPEYLAMLGYTPSGGSGGGNMQSALSASEISSILAGITDSTQRAACEYALNRVGYPYSQDLRDSGNYYDCSSLAYFSWKAAGKDISYGGATTAAAEAQGLNEAGKSINYDEMQPGDLIFYSTSANGRYMNITHVAVYVGNGKVVEALNESYGVVYQDVRTGNIVLMCRP